MDPYLGDVGIGRPYGHAIKMAGWGLGRPYGTTWMLCISACPPLKWRAGGWGCPYGTS